MGSAPHKKRLSPGTPVMVFPPRHAGDVLLLRIGGRIAPCVAGQWFNGVEAQFGNVWRPLETRIVRVDVGADADAAVEFRDSLRGLVFDWSLTRYWLLRWQPPVDTADILMSEWGTRVCPPDARIDLPPPWLLAAVLWSAKDATQLQAVSAFADADSHAEFCDLRVPPADALAIEESRTRLHFDPHPCISSWLDCVFVEGGALLRMSRESGCNLSEAWSRGELRHEAQALAFAQAAAALDHLDAIGIAHGHVDPRLMRWHQGKLKLTHIGIPSHLELIKSRSNLTVPEFAAGNRSSAASDQFQLALAWLELRCGALPQSDMELQDYLQGSSPQTQAAALAAAEREALARALHPDPEHRWPSSGQFVTALLSARQKPQSRERAVPVRPQSRERVVPARPSWAAIAWPLTLLALVAWLLWRFT